MESHYFTEPEPVLSQEEIDIETAGDTPPPASSSSTPPALPTWRVHVHRKGVPEAVGTLYVDKNSLPPRRGRGGKNSKIVWQLPESHETVPKFGLYEQRRLWEMYKAQKKERRKKFRQSATDSSLNERDEELERKSSSPTGQAEKTQNGTESTTHEQPNDEPQTDLTAKETAAPKGMSRSEQLSQFQARHPSLTLSMSSSASPPTPAPSNTNTTSTTRENGLETAQPPPPPGFDVSQMSLEEPSATATSTTTTSQATNNKPTTSIPLRYFVFAPAVVTADQEDHDQSTTSNTTNDTLQSPPVDWQILQHAVATQLVQTFHRFVTPPPPLPMAPMPTMLAPTTNPHDWLLDWIGHYRPSTATSTCVMGTAKGHCTTCQQRAELWQSLTGKLVVNGITTDFWKQWECQGWTVQLIHNNKTSSNNNNDNQLQSNGTNGTTNSSKKKKKRSKSKNAQSDNDADHFLLVVMTGKTLQQPNQCFAFSLTFVLKRCGDTDSSSAPSFCYQIDNEVLVLTLCA